MWSDDPVRRLILCWALLVLIGWKPVTGSRPLPLMYFCSRPFVLDHRKGTLLIGKRKCLAMSIFGPNSFFPKTMLTLWSLNRMKSPTDVWLPPQLFWHRANLIYSRHLKLVSLILVLNNIINIIRFGTTCKQKIITQRKLQKAQQSRYFDCQHNFSKHW